METCDAEVWAQLESLNPSVPNKSIVRRATGLGHERFTIGRSKASHLAFPDDRLISQVHCSILAEAPAHASGTCSLNVKLLDSSLNGTFVNGQRVGVGNSVRLNDGDIISLVVVPTEREDGSFGVHGTKGDRVSIFDVLDANGDGRITRQEYNAGFDILDKDRNGFLTRQEFGTSSAAPFNVLDKDGDNRLSRIEWEAGFDHFDKDGDGFVTRAEFIAEGGETAWGKLVFGDNTQVELSLAPGTPFVIGHDVTKCARGHVVVDEWVSPQGQKGRRVSSTHCNIKLPSALCEQMPQQPTGALRRLQTQATPHVEGSGAPLADPPAVRAAAVLQDTSTNGTWLNFDRIHKHEERRLQNGDLIKLVNPADATCPDNLFFTFYDTRPIPFIAYRIRLQPVTLTRVETRGHDPAAGTLAYDAAPPTSPAPRRSGETGTAFSGPLEYEAAAGEGGGGGATVAGDTGGGIEGKVEEEKADPLEAIDWGGKKYEDVLLQGALLGQGSFGNVYVATHKQKTALQVAVKVFDLRRMRYTGKKIDDETEKLRKEMRVHASLRHRNIVRLYTCFEEQHFYYLVLEWVRGGDLFDFLADMRQEEVSEEQAKYMFAQLLAGVQYLHEKGVVHRDLKPENVMLADKSERPHLKITDFGESKELVGGARCKTHVGTEATMAPEVFLLVKKSARLTIDGKIADIWGLGIILHVMLTIFYPFQSSEDTAYRYKMASVATGEVKRPPLFRHQGWKNKSAQVKELLDGLLQQNPAERWSIEKAQSCEWFRERDSRRKGLRPTPKSPKPLTPAKRKMDK